MEHYIVCVDPQVSSRIAGRKLPKQIDPGSEGRVGLWAPSLIVNQQAAPINSVHPTRPQPHSRSLANQRSCPAKKINHWSSLLTLLRPGLHTSPANQSPVMFTKSIAISALLVLLALQLLDAASASRSLLSANRSCACPYSYMPVCGSDAKQYANRCMAECAGVKVTKEGAFDAKICQNIAVDPIDPQRPQRPGSDRQTLPAVRPPRPLNMNTNSAASANPPCRCPKIYLPVCGSDGKLYNNKCLAECQQGVKVTDTQPDANRNCLGTSGRHLQSSNAVNQPRRVCPCPRIYRPVCGSNGKQYDNECIARCEGVSIAGPASGTDCASGSTGSSATGTSTSGPATSGPTVSGPVARPATTQPGPNVQPIVPGPVTTGSGPASGPVSTGSGPASGSGPVPTGSGQPLPRPSNPRQDVGQFGFSCGCQVTYEPVCGKDAKWYPNMCSLNCASVGLSAVRPDKYGNCLVG